MRSKARAGRSSLLICLLAASADACFDWCITCGIYCCHQTECALCVETCDLPRPPPPPLPAPHPPPHPPLAPHHAAAAAEYWTQGSRIFTNAWSDSDTGEAAAVEVRIKGLNWFGLESRRCVLGGAGEMPLADIARFVASHGFNAVRLPLAADALLGSDACRDDDVYQTYDADIAAPGISYVGQVERLALLFAEHGLLLLLDIHVMVAGKWPDSGAVGQEMGTLGAAWELLATRLCDAKKFWNVFGADLKNEPHAMWWGEPPAAHDAGAYARGERWDARAAALGSRVFALCPRWLVVVEGVGHCQGSGQTEGGLCRQPSAAGQEVGPLARNAFWGENLQGVDAAPVRLAGADEVLGKVVYSPHTYGPSVSYQSYFTEAGFPANMPAVWELQYGHLARRGTAPVLVGEWGGKFTGADRTLQLAFAAYLAEAPIVGSFYWCLNPDSGDTGGLVRRPWKGLVPETGKLAMLEGLPRSPVPTTAQRARPPPTPPPPPPPLPPPSPPVSPTLIQSIRSPPPPTASQLPAVLPATILRAPPPPRLVQLEIQQWWQVPPPPPASALWVPFSIRRPPPPPPGPTPLPPPRPQRLPPSIAQPRAQPMRRPGAVRSATRTTDRYDRSSSSAEKARRHRVLVLVVVVIVAAAAIVLVITTLHSVATLVRWLWRRWMGTPTDHHEAPASGKRCSRDRPSSRAAPMTDTVGSKRGGSCTRGERKSATRKSPARPARVRSSGQRRGGGKYAAVTPSVDAAAVLARIDDYYSDSDG